jgi:flagellin-like protein
MKVQMDKSIQKQIRSRRAVAPIIATLLLIAIAVIGGVMIYVFTQGFFGNSSITSSPSVDTITMTGYDMREIDATPPCDPTTAVTTGVTTHENEVTCYGDSGLAVDVGRKVAGEEGAIFIRNVGSEGYTISKLEVNDVELDFVSTDAGMVAAGGTYVMYSIADAADDVAGTTPLTAQEVLPGEEATLVVSFDVDSEAASGRTIPVKITSASGSVYNFNVVIGSKS